MRKWSILVAGSAVAAFSLGFQGTAPAATTAATGWPTGCSYGDNAANGAWASCKKSNGGHYKAVATCNRMDGVGRVDVEASTWRSSGSSYVYCPPFTLFSYAGIITKAS